jgi:hypothetical protein
MSASHTPFSERDLELLSAYLDGELTDREQRSLEQRLARDNALRTELDRLRDTVALVGELPRLRAPRQFTLDPAVYGRKVPWWQRVLSLETALQISGALGAAASLAIIILAVVLSSRSGNQKAEVQPAAGSEAAFAITNAEPTSLATMLTAERTSIAYGGEGLFQATMAMHILRPEPGSIADCHAIRHGACLSTGRHSHALGSGGRSSGRAARGSIGGNIDGRQRPHDRARSGGSISGDRSAHPATRQRTRRARRSRCRFCAACCSLAVRGN